MQRMGGALPGPGPSDAPDYQEEVRASWRRELYRIIVRQPTRRQLQRRRDRLPGSDRVMFT
jgi:hypothetical protein